MVTSAVTGFKKRSRTHSFCSRLWRPSSTSTSKRPLQTSSSGKMVCKSGNQRCPGRWRTAWRPAQVYLPLRLRWVRPPQRGTVASFSSHTRNRRCHTANAFEPTTTSVNPHCDARPRGLHRSSRLRRRRPLSFVDLDTRGVFLYIAPLSWWCPRRDGNSSLLPTLLQPSVNVQPGMSAGV